MSVKLRVVGYKHPKRKEAFRVWWIEGIPEFDGRKRCGPYQTKADAESDRQGMQKIFDNLRWK